MVLHNHNEKDDWNFFLRPKYSPFRVHLERVESKVLGNYAICIQKCDFYDIRGEVKGLKELNTLCQ